MINVQIKLISLVFDHQYAKYQILSLKPDSVELPSFMIEANMDIDQTLQYMLSLYNNNHNNDRFHNFKLTDISVKDVLEIYYMTFITYEVTIQNSFLLDLSTINNLPTNAQNIISLL